MNVSFLKNGILSYLNKRAISKPLNSVREKISDKPLDNIAPPSHSMVVMSAQTEQPQSSSSAPKIEFQKNTEEPTSSSVAESYQKSYDSSPAPIQTQDIYILV